MEEFTTFLGKLVGFLRLVVSQLEKVTTIARTYLEKLEKTLIEWGVKV